jgi:nucleotidyltransferase substrate binding protein (TIGR01987 family)
MTARREALAAAIGRLRDVLKAPESDVTRDAAIQRFEFCFELAWKCIQERARDEGLDCQSPKGCLSVAFKTSWIENEQGWLAMPVSAPPKLSPAPRRITQQTDAVSVRSITRE